MFFQYICSYCAKGSFKSRFTLKQHERNCAWCNHCQSFQTKPHVSKCKGEKDVKKKYCRLCNTYVGRRNWSQHLRLRHDDAVEIDEVGIHAIVFIG